MSGNLSDFVDKCAEEAAEYRELGDSLELDEELGAGGDYGLPDSGETLQKARDQVRAAEEMTLQSRVREQGAVTDAVLRAADAALMKGETTKGKGRGGSGGGPNSARKVSTPGTSRGATPATAGAGSDYARLIALEEECARLTVMARDKDKEVHILRAESAKQQSLIATLTKKVEKDRVTHNTMASDIKLLESQLATAKKEITVQMRHASAPASATKKTTEELRLQKALSELETTRSKLDELQKKQRDASAGDGKEGGEIDILRLENSRLESHNAELVTIIRKQNKLVDVLKRQKMHLEAAKLLSFTEEEFLKVLQTSDH